MPRVENLGKNVDEWYRTKANGNGSSTWDVCRAHALELVEDPHALDEKLTPYNGDPPGDAGRGGDVDHPCYGDDRYTCAVCGQILGPEDEEAPPGLEDNTDEQEDA